MWNDSKSIVLSRISVIAFMVLLVLAVIFAPWIVSMTFSYAVKPGWDKWFLVTIYTGCIPAAALLLSLYRLLRRIERGEVFIQKNVESLRHISWFCFAGAVISAVSALYYISWIMVAVAAAFVALIVRVVKNVFARAVSLQDDADFTI
ncbi:Protein of unknown function [Sporobacter termitidis DSM 10068]|uniref:DUF2975 domain-containing protein n=1 Tax=Sporobacter termitidis DSM 10068 TaxID=1123282 RepID=A0A1M5VJX7_9FIRM|nr:DUF2975 domain-containing protein [Sporobacter termitidis]SHH75374.1 Protein of unknown function [Sporobacter termitidis DSM 10068]